MFLNIHTHHAPSTETCGIQSFFENFNRVDEQGYYSIGLHPWFITQQNYLHDFESLKTFSTNKNVLAIGECGLDKICNTDFDLQQTVFIEQIKLAEEIQKPLVIHCVKAWQEVFVLLKLYRKNVPVIFHGFNKNFELAKKIVDNGYYISFGNALSKESVKQILKVISLNRVFFETDDAGVTIESIYQIAAGVLAIDINSLCLQIKNNADAVFGVERFKI